MVGWQVLRATPKAAHHEKTHTKGTSEGGGVAMPVPGQTPINRNRSGTDAHDLDKVFARLEEEEKEAKAKQNAKQGIMPTYTVKEVNAHLSWPFHQATY